LNYDVVALGELLIDFTSCGMSEQNNPIFEANPGGAPGNVLSMLAKLGKKTAFIGKVGDDMFGRILIDTLAKSGIASDSVLIEKTSNTTLAFVHNAPDGDREFSFFRKPGADTLLHTDELSPELLGNCKIFHFGTLSLTHQPAKGSTIKAVAIAKDAGSLISFDPNLRPLLWDSLDEARRQISWGLSVCDILKIADDELIFVTGAADLESGIGQLRDDYPQIKLILLTKGKEGADGFWGELRFSHPPFLKVNTIDTTGAGDTFLGSCLAHVLDFGIDSPTQGSLEQMIVFANAASSLVTTKKGALLSMPEKSEILALIEQGL